MKAKKTEKLWIFEGKVPRGFLQFKFLNSRFMMAARSWIRVQTSKNKQKQSADCKGGITHTIFGVPLWSRKENLYLKSSAKKRSKKKVWRCSCTASWLLPRWTNHKSTAFSDFFGNGFDKFFDLSEESCIIKSLKSAVAKTRIKNSRHSTDASLCTLTVTSLPLGVLHFAIEILKLQLEISRQHAEPVDSPKNRYHGPLLILSWTSKTGTPLQGVLALIPREHIPLQCFVIFTKAI